MDPDERGRVDRRNVFRFVKCMLPGVPDRALDGVVDGLMKAVQDGGEQGAHVHDSTPKDTAKNISGRRQMFVGDFLEQADFVERLTLSM